MRRWCLQADADAGRRQGVRWEASATFDALRADNRRLLEDVAVLKAVTVTTFFAGEPPPIAMIGELHGYFLHVPPAE